ncbi:MAG: putative peroxidase-related enzyme [Luteibaculaceae bacterium]|jgi:uncharacterized peroxidase-related enzyme
MARIKVIQPQEAEGKLADIYSDLESSRGKIAEVHKIQSLRPESIVKHMDLYLEIMYTKSKLSRAKRELIAVVVSVANACTYCKTHHAAALNHYWKNDERIAQLLISFENVGLSDEELALCRFAQHLTLNPGHHENTDHTAALKKVGLPDEAILDTTLVVAYFNFVNRIVLSLGVQLENHAGTGFDY